MQRAPVSMEEVAPAVPMAIERQHRLFWWKEALIVAAFYGIYSWTRNQFGSNRVVADGVPEHAFHNAERVIRFERFLGLFHEESIQDLFQPLDWVMQVMNVYYGIAHFVVTIAVFVLLFVKRKSVFPQWRNTLAATTALAIVGFALFPLMPPRLLDKSCVDYGARCIESSLRPEGGGFGFQDSLNVYGGTWSFDDEGMATISNQYAAMPSLHVGWALWSAVALWPLLRYGWQRIVVLGYPLLTTFSTIVTANHYWLDAVGGLFVFAVGALLGWGLHRWNQDRLDRASERGLETTLEPSS
jgi:membrane-associated phospholipid phosphatase